MQQSARERRRKERYFQKRRDKEDDRKFYITQIAKYAWMYIGCSVFFCAMAATCAWLICFNYGSQLEPYSKFIYVTAGSFSMFVVCTLFCSYCAIWQENFTMYFFVVAIVFFAFYSMLLAISGMVIMKTNWHISFYDNKETLKEVLTWGYIVGGFLGFACLLCTGVAGLRINAYAKENFFGRKLRSQCCPDFSPDMDKLTEEAELRAKKKLDDLPKADMYSADFEQYHQSFVGVLDLQQGANDRDERDFFQLQDLVCAIPGLTQLDVEGPRSTDMAIDYCPEVKDRPCHGRLLPNKQLKSEVFFRNAWGTAIALALLRSKLPSWCDEPGQAKLVRNGMNQEKQVEIFQRILSETTAEMEAKFAQMSSGGQGGSKGAGVGDGDEVQVDIDEEDSPLGTAGKDVNESVSWIEPVRTAVVFLNHSLQKQRIKNPDMKSTAIDWVTVANALVKSWIGSTKRKR